MIVTRGFGNNHLIITRGFSQLVTGFINDNIGRIVQALKRQPTPSIVIAGPTEIRGD